MQKADARQNLINAARQLLIDGKPFTVKDITARAYTNVAAINYYFGDKNTLINLVLNELVEGYRKTIVETLRQEYSSPAECIEAFLTLVGEMYSENTGVIKYLVTADTGSKAKIIQSILFDEELTRLVSDKMSQMTGECRQEVQICNYLICVSSFILPLLLEVQNENGNFGVALSALQGEHMRRVFVSQLMKLFS
ncbi:MAG: TetR family transcriptional regulator [Clostridia bacterium]|nr:TetR family transcriptional regulator [Clostridia bacterium]